MATETNAETIGDAPGGDLADERMTAERDETKYLISPDAVPRVVAALGRELRHHRFAGNGANHLPGPQHFVTTVYFDTPSRRQYHASRASQDENVKMRAKEYYDVHPSLAQLATDPRQLVKYQRILWLELKFKSGGRTGKQRVGIPKADLPRFFAEGAVTPEMIEIQRGEAGAAGERVLGEIAAYCASLAEPVRADCLVNYRRLPWQDAAGTLRITLDLGVEYFAPPADLWQRREALVRDSLGAPSGTEPRAVMEIKSRGSLPGWLGALLDRAGAAHAAFSKFEAASQAVHP